MIQKIKQLIRYFLITKINILELKENDTLVITMNPENATKATTHLFTCKLKEKMQSIFPNNHILIINKNVDISVISDTE